MVQGGLQDQQWKWVWQPSTENGKPDIIQGEK